MSSTNSNVSVGLRQEMERLKEELENMNDLMEQKDSLTQKLEVSSQGEGRGVAPD